MRQPVQAPVRPPRAVLPLHQHPPRPRRGDPPRHAPEFHTGEIDMTNMQMTLSEQIDRLVAENQHLRVKSENDDKTLHLLKEQYRLLAAQVEGINAAASRK